ncbi:hypothetical protein [Nitratireductor aquibiodomus]|uniref:hypothetical protein n=1 Tax=Nitratireductor aquibiodomus TaxID=204799 RepID=UPI0002EFCCFD|nr:hypothetical protein [Nitratireductor aquibiodomus]
MVAYQYVKAGANVLAVLDAASFADKVKASVLMAAAPGQLLRGLAFRRYLARNGVALHEAPALSALRGDRKWRACGSPRAVGRTISNATLWGWDSD